MGDSPGELFNGFLRGVEGKPPQGPAADFITEYDLAHAEGLKFNANNQDGKIFLGLVNAKVQTSRNPETGRLDRHAVGGTAIGVRDDRHIITVAGSRAGKGRSVLIPNLLSYPGSVLVIDPKGELATLTARHRRQKLGQRVHVVDPFRTCSGFASEPEQRSIFNPIAGLSPDSPTLLEDAGLIADSLVQPSGHDAHWDDSAKQLIETLILHVATSETRRDRRDLLRVAELLRIDIEQPSDPSDPDSPAVLQIELIANAAAGGAVVAGAYNYYQREDRERLSVLSTARRHLHFLGYQQMQETLRGVDSIDLGELKRKPTTIYLTLPAMRMGTCSRWLRLFVNLTLAAMEAERVKPQHQVLLCLDEFAVLGTMKTVEDAAGQIAGLGVKLWPVLQDLGQLKALYKDRWETFLGNAGVLQFFGNADLTTLEWVSKRLGETMVINPSRSDVPLETRVSTGSRGESWSQQSQPLLTAEEISRFFGRDDVLQRQLIIRPTYPPMVLQRANRDSHELFSGKCEDDAKKS